MAIGTRPGEIREYTLKQDRPEKLPELPPLTKEEQEALDSSGGNKESTPDETPAVVEKILDPTFFSIKTLTAMEQAEILDMEGHKSTIAALNLGIVGWKNLKDSEGVDIPFPKTGPADFLPCIVWGELENAVLNSISEDLKKK